MSDTILDAIGEEITVGARFVTPVRTYTAPNVYTDEILTGVVTATSDADGDVDDYGRTIGYNPTVSVLYDDGCEDVLNTHVDIRGWGDYMRELPWICDDITIVEPTLDERVRAMEPSGEHKGTR
jgi:hypothetical protein